MRALSPQPLPDLPQLYTLPDPSWDGVGPFQNSLIVPGIPASYAGSYLQRCHHPERGLLVDNTSQDNAVTCVRVGDAVAWYWGDESLLLGRQKPEGIAWYGAPFCFLSPFFERAKRRRVIISHSSIKGSHIDGPADLACAWNDALKEDIHRWVSMLGDDPPSCGGLDDGTIVSPCFPFKDPSEDERDAFEAYMIAALRALGLTDPDASVFLYGYQPTTKGWKLPDLDIWQHKTDNPEKILPIINRFKALLIDPRFPYTKRGLIQNGRDTGLLSLLNVGYPTSHDIMAARHLVMHHQTLP